MKVLVDEEKKRLYRSIQAFAPANEQEAADKKVILHALETVSAVFDRGTQAHMTCSIWVVDPACTQTLMVHHNIYHSWSWIGGHADGRADLSAVALRELEEETGVSNATLLLGGDVFSLEVLTVAGHEKHGAYVSSHLHLNVTYAAQANPEASRLRTKPDENSGVAWVPLDQVCAVSDEPWICDRVYRKLIEKTRTMLADNR